MKQMTKFEVMLLRFAFTEQETKWMVKEYDWPEYSFKFLVSEEVGLLDEADLELYLDCRTKHDLLPFLAKLCMRLSDRLIQQYTEGGE